MSPDNLSFFCVFKVSRIFVKSHILIAMIHVHRTFCGNINKSYILVSHRVKNLLMLNIPLLQKATNSNLNTFLIYLFKAVERPNAKEISSIQGS